MKFKVGIKIKLLTLTTVGSIGEVFIDKTTLRRYGAPVIPATSIKGAMRTAFCYVAKDKGYPCCCSKGLSEDESSHAFVKLKDGRALCTACLVFGRDYWEPLLKLDDCRPKAYLTNVRTRIALNKALGTVSEGRLFVVEEIAPGSIFECNGEIDFDRLNNLDLMGKSREDVERIIRELLMSNEFKDAFLYVGLGNGMARIELEVRE